MNGRYVVDTNVIIKLFRADQHSIDLFVQADVICIPAIVAGELFYGAEKSTLRQKNIMNFTSFLSHYEIIEVDLQIAQSYGEIKAQLMKDGVTLPENDLWIAATAKAKGYTLISFDEHFTQVGGLQIIN